MLVGHTGTVCPARNALIKLHPDPKDRVEGKPWDTGPTESQVSTTPHKLVPGARALEEPPVCRKAACPRAGSTSWLRLLLCFSLCSCPLASSLGPDPPLTLACPKSSLPHLNTTGVMSHAWLGWSGNCQGLLLSPLCQGANFVFTHCGHSRRARAYSL